MAPITEAAPMSARSSRPRRSSRPARSAWIPGGTAIVARSVPKSSHRRGSADHRRSASTPSARRREGCPRRRPRFGCDARRHLRLAEHQRDHPIALGLVEWRQLEPRAACGDGPLGYMSTNSDRARQTMTTGTPDAVRTTSSTRASSVGSAQWRSSTTATTGPLLSDALEKPANGERRRVDRCLGRGEPGQLRQSIGEPGRVRSTTRAVPPASPAPPAESPRRRCSLPVSRSRPAARTWSRRRRAGSGREEPCTLRPPRRGTRRRGATCRRPRRRGSSRAGMPVPRLHAGAPTASMSRSSFRPTMRVRCWPETARAASSHAGGGRPSLGAALPLSSTGGSSSASTAPLTSR